MTRLISLKFKMISWIISKWLIVCSWPHLPLSSIIESYIKHICNQTSSPKKVLFSSHWKFFLKNFTKMFDCFNRKINNKFRNFVFDRLFSNHHNNNNNNIINFCLLLRDNLTDWRRDGQTLSIPQIACS